MKIHELKIEDQFIPSLLDGTKTAETRRNDRDFQTGDQIRFISIPVITGIDSPARRPDHIADALITHVYQGEHGVKEGYAVLSIQLLETEEEKARRSEQVAELMNIALKNPHLNTY
jgi:hypothetical protein